MKFIRATVPAKTFIVGEYAVLEGGKALILSTAPPFELSVLPRNEPGLEFGEIHPDSPAGRLMQEEVRCFQDYRFQFIDPYRGLGGLGASSAQFLLLYAFKQYLVGEDIDDAALLKVYRALSSQGAGRDPSGADLMAQRHGGISLVSPSASSARVLPWPFEDLAYALIHTGRKVATHLHLADLKDVPAESLHPLVEAALGGMEQADSGRFVRAVRDYGAALASAGLRAEESGRLLERLASCPFLLAAKGCGALGADLIFALFPREDLDRAAEWLRERHFHLIAMDREPVPGLHLKFE